MLVLKALVAMFFDEMQSHAVDGGLQIPVQRASNPGVRRVAWGTVPGCGCVQKKQLNNSTVVVLLIYE